MALYQNGILVSGANTLPQMTLAEYQALPVSERPTYWERTDLNYNNIPSSQVTYGSGSVEDALDGLIRGSVSVTSDGTMTYTSIFNALFALVDISKLSLNSKLVDEKSGNVNIYTITQFVPTQIIFSTSRSSGSGTGCEEAILNASTSTYYHCEGTSRQDWGTAKPSSGHIFTIYY